MEHGLAKTVATLALEPTDLTDRLGLKFETAKDDLDDLDAALLRHTSGRQFALVRHRRQPRLGTDILINERSQDLVADLREILDFLQLSVHELQWVHPKIARKALGKPSNCLSAKSVGNNPKIVAKTS